MTQTQPGAGVILALAGLLAGPAPAEDFTFRRITVDDAPAGKRITVQIDPEAQAQRLAAPPPAPAPPPDSGPAPRGAGPYAWFWDSVAPQGPADPARFLAARDALTTPPAGQQVPAPRLQTLQEIAARHAPALLRSTAGSRVSPALALAVIAVESAGQADAVSSAGAQGLMQLIPDTAARFDVADPFDPAANIRGGVAYLDWLLTRFDRDVVLALAGYNAGEGAVAEADGVPAYPETRGYVPKVLAAWLVARGLCATPPALPGDPCVFKIAQAG